MQDSKGMLYVGGGDRAFTYNGTAWEPLPINDNVRVMTEDAHGTVFVGTVAGFGYLHQDLTGKKQYVSLFDQLSEPEKVLPTTWDIQPTKEGVYIRNQRFIFLFRRDKDGNYQKVASLPSNYDYSLTFRGKNQLYALETSDDRKFSHFSTIKSQLKTVVYTANAHIIKKTTGLVELGPNKLMLFTENEGIYLLDLENQQLEEMAAPANAILKKAFVYTVIELRNGNLAVGTTYNGILILDKKGAVVQHITEKDNLISNTIFTLLEDRQGSLWVGTGQGLARIDLSLPFATYNKYHNIKNRTHAVLKYQNLLYIGNDVGLLYLKNERFEVIPGTESQVWQLQPYGAGLLIAGGNTGLLYVEGKRIVSQLELPNSTMQFWVSKQDSTILYVATYGGVNVFSFENQQFKDLGLLHATQTDCRSLYELPDGRLWVGTTNQGFYRVHFPQGKKTVQSVQQAQVKHYTTGLNETQFNKIFEVDHQPYFTSRTGLYSFDEANEVFVKSNLVNVDFHLPRYQRPIVKEDSHGNVWLLNGLAIAWKQENGGFRLDSLSLRPIGKTAAAMYEDENDTYWLANSEGLFRFDHKNAGQSMELGTRITQVSLSNIDSLLPLAPKGDNPLDYEFNSLIFNFSAFNFLNEKGDQYQYKLDQYDEEWSTWTSRAQKEYTNLPEGTYTFRVRSRNAYGRPGQEATYAFAIKAPWYRSWWAYLAYFSLGTAVVYLITFLYTQNLLREKAKLEAVVQVRTKEILAQNEVLSQQNDAILRQKAELFSQKEEIMTQSKELAQMNATKDKLFSIISHDLRSPFNQLNGILKLLDMDGLTQAEFQHFAKELHKNTDTLSDMLDNLLRWSILQMQQGIAANLKNLHPRAVADAVIQLYGASINDKAITIFNLIPPDLVAWADPDQVKLILRNLIANAIKFTHSGGEIRVGGQMVGDRLEITVSDFGVGMSPAQMAELFTIQTNSSKAGTSGETGTGIGLLLVKEFVENNGGTISVQSEVGQGSSFSFTLQPGQANPV